MGGEKHLMGGDIINFNCFTTACHCYIIFFGSVCATCIEKAIKYSIANLTVSEYTKLYRQEEDYQYITDYEYISPRCYDGIWVTALTLNCTNQILHETGQTLRVESLKQHLMAGGFYFYICMSLFLR